MKFSAADRVAKGAFGKTLVVTERESIRLRPASELPALLRPGDVLAYNNSSVLPASFSGLHPVSNRRVEMRLVNLLSPIAAEWIDWGALIWSLEPGPSEPWRVPTESRQPAPFIREGDRIELGGILAVVRESQGQNRFSVRFIDEQGHPLRGVLPAMLKAGRPIQYAYHRQSLDLWDVQTLFTGPAVSIEPPSAAFILDWEGVSTLTQKGIRLCPITHAAGISSLGPIEVDAQLPFPEWSYLSEGSAQILNAAKEGHSRIIALGTTVARCLESAYRLSNPLKPGWFLAEGKLGSEAPALFIDALITGLHDEKTSHYALEGALIPSRRAAEANAMAAAAGLKDHEFGDFHFIENQSLRAPHREPVPV